MTQNILIVEDDPGIRDLVQYHLSELGCQVDCASDGSAGLEMALEKSYNLIVLDLGLPKLGGFEVCKEIRKYNDQVRIVMLTSKSDELDKILGLELGADDYVTKPFSVRELATRVKSLLRRQASEVTSARDSESDVDVLKFGNLAIDRRRYQVLYEGKPVQLTVMEFDLLLVLASNPGKTFSKTELIQHLGHYQSEVYEEIITTHISRIRKKLELNPSIPHFIHTVRGVGYRFVEPHEIRPPS